MADLKDQIEINEARAGDIVQVASYVQPTTHEVATWNWRHYTVERVECLASGAVLLYVERDAIDRAQGAAPFLLLTGRHAHAKLKRVPRVA